MLLYLICAFVDFIALFLELNEAYQYKYVAII